MSSLFSLAFTVFSVYCVWMIFEKAGEAGWKSIIPVYSSYVMYKISNRKGYFWMYLIGMVLLIVGFTFVAAGIIAASVYDGGLTEEELSVFMMFLVPLFIGLILVLIARWKQCRGLADNFDMNTAFVFGLFLLPVVFQAILALDPANTYKSYLTFDYVSNRVDDALK